MARMKKLFIEKNGKKIAVTAIEMGENAVMDDLKRKYDTKYVGYSVEGDEYTVYECKGYFSYGYSYE